MPKVREKSQNQYSWLQNLRKKFKEFEKERQMRTISCAIFLKKQLEKEHCKNLEKPPQERLDPVDCEKYLNDELLYIILKLENLEKDEVIIREIVDEILQKYEEPQVSEEVNQVPGEEPQVSEEVDQVPGEEPQVSEEVNQVPGEEPQVSEEVDQVPGEEPHVKEEEIKVPEEPQVQEEKLQRQYKCLQNMADKLGNRIKRFRNLEKDHERRVEHLKRILDNLVEKPQNPEQKPNKSESKVPRPKRFPRNR